MPSSGLRLQLLLLLGGLLLLAFLPLQLALSTYTQVTLRQLDDAQARALGRTLTAYVREAERHLSPEELMQRLQFDAGGQAVWAALIGPRAGGAQAQFGQPAMIEALAASKLEDGGEPAPLRTARGRALAFLAGESGSVRLLVGVDRSSSRGAALIGMFGLYTFLIAVSLLTVAYFALTRLLVRPIAALSEAAQSVTLGARHLAVPPSRVRELAALGDSLARMTDRLLTEERSLRNKIDEVERATAELSRAQNQVVRAERLASVGRLAAGLAHEIGNPLSALMGLQDLLLSAELEPHEQRDFVKRMRAETERIHRTLRDLLAFARPAREQDQSKPSAGDVEAAVHDTAALVMHQSSLRAVELAIDVHPGLPRVTLATEQLVQVLLNLVLNAADALQGQSGARVRVSAETRGPGVLIAVEDNGPGVAAPDVEHIFEPFYTTKEVGKGTGLGLSVCLGLVAAAGGSLSLDASFTRGARFVVQLPALDELASHRAGSGARADGAEQRAAGGDPLAPGAKVE